MARDWMFFVLAILTIGCGGGGTGAPGASASPHARVTTNADCTLNLTPTAWAPCGANFTSAAGAVDVVARVDSPVPVVYQIDLLYVGGAGAHNEGSGGVSAQGPGPLLSAHWEVGSSGPFTARLFPVSQAPLPVPPQGVNIPVVFTITHP